MSKNKQIGRFDNTFMQNVIRRIVMDAMTRCKYMCLVEGGPGSAFPRSVSSAREKSLLKTFKDC